MKTYFEDFDFTDFWDDCDESEESYISDYPDDAIIAKVQGKLGYKLPESYIEFMKIHNGGLVKRNCFPIDYIPTIGTDFVDFYGFLGIGSAKICSLLGDVGSAFWIDHWHYPNIGIAICDTPSAGHDLIFLDYSKVGAEGEPEVVHICEENDFKVTFLAKDFETFIKSLKYEGDFADK
ncbi:MAG: SMI1/KNR4 family protein [Clostridiales bacterium]